MKTIVALTLAAGLMFMNIGCVKSTTTNPPGQPTSPNVGVIVALDSLSAACTISSGLVSGPVAAFLSGPCSTAATGILDIVEANGTAAQIQATISTLQAEAAQLPPATSYITYANAAIALAQEVLTIYEQVTGQAVTAGTAKFSNSFTPIIWTGAQRRHIEKLKASLTVKRADIDVPTCGDNCPFFA